MYDDYPRRDTTLPSTPIRLINPLWDAHGGSDWRAIEMYRALLDRAPVQLWSEFTPAREFANRFPIHLISPWRGKVPIGGTFLVVGAYFRLGHWFRLALPKRTILIYNTHQPDRLAKMLRRLRAWHRTPVEVVYTSPSLRRMSGGPAGPVIESPIDLARFVPREGAAATPNGFTVGRLSRDIATKHHDEDPAVYAALDAAGVNLRIMGGTCLRGHVDASLESALLPAGQQRPLDFLQGLDCFYYRTSERWTEAYGRVVFEAMACGLPVVCCRRGGYADYIAHGVNGFLFDTTEQAVRLLLRLRNDGALRRRVGAAARRSVEELYRGDAWRRKWQFFLGGAHGADAAAAAVHADPTASGLF